MTQISRLYRYTIYCVLISICAIWGGAFVAIKYLLGYLTPIQLVEMRYFIASAIFMLILFILKKRQVFQIIKEHPFKLLIISFFGVMGYNLSLAYGEVRIAAGTASIITNLSPIFNLVLAAILLNERMNKSKIFGLFLAFFGLTIIVIFAPGSELKLNYFLYILITLAAPLSWAIYTVVNKPMSEKYDSFALTGISIIAGTALFLFFVRANDFKAAASLPSSGWFSLLFLSVACTILGFTGWVWALKKLPSTEVASFTYLAPVFSILLGNIFLSESINAGIICGAATLLFGVWMTNKN